MARAPACVYCRERPSDPRYRPFCSERCRMADLGRWLGGSYRIGGGPAGDRTGMAISDEPGGDPDGFSTGKT